MNEKNKPQECANAPGGNFTAEEVAKSLRACHGGSSPCCASCICYKHSGYAHGGELKPEFYEICCKLEILAANLIEAQAERIKELEEELRWIPVTERNPDQYQAVQIFDGDVDVACFRFGNFNTIDQYESDIITGVTHWKPLSKEPEVGHD